MKDHIVLTFVQSTLFLSLGQDRTPGSLVGFEVTGLLEGNAVVGFLVGNAVVGL